MRNSSIIEVNSGGKKETHIGLGNLEEEDEVDLSIGKEKVSKHGYHQISGEDLLHILIFSQGEYGAFDLDGPENVFH